MGIMGLILIGILVWAVIVYNNLIRNRTHVREAFSGIDVQLKRRHDLIPMLVDTVKGYMQHERSLLEQVTKLRS
jgi:LemA protein